MSCADGPPTGGCLSPRFTSGFCDDTFGCGLDRSREGGAGLHRRLNRVKRLAQLRLLAAKVANGKVLWRSVHADRSERVRALPGDELIPTPLATLTHAVTIDRVPESIWPWLAQMGAGRAGWYSYDCLDNGSQPSATRIVAERQSIAVGTVFPALPGATDGFKVLAFELNAWLLLGWAEPNGAPLVTWAFLLESRASSGTRLITRVRGSHRYRFQGLPAALSKPIVRVVHFVMQRRQLLGIARRAESVDTALPPDIVAMPEAGRFQA